MIVSCNFERCCVMADSVFSSASVQSDCSPRVVDGRDRGCG